MMIEDVHKLVKRIMTIIKIWSSKKSQEWIFSLLVSINADYYYVPNV